MRRMRCLSEGARILNRSGQVSIESELTWVEFTSFHINAAS
jgi:hypothetical protein